MELHTDSSTTVVLGQCTMWQNPVSRKPWTNGLTVLNGPLDSWTARLSPSIQGQEWVGLIVDR